MTGASHLFKHYSKFNETAIALVLHFSRRSFVLSLKNVLKSDKFTFKSDPMLSFFLLNHFYTFWTCRFHVINLLSCGMQSKNALNVPSRAVPHRFVQIKLQLIRLAKLRNEISGVEGVRYRNGGEVTF